MYINGRRIYISPRLLAGEKIEIFETLDWLEDENSRFYFLSDYKIKICRPLRHYSDGAWQEDVYRSERLICPARFSTTAMSSAGSTGLAMWI